MKIQNASIAGLSIALLIVEAANDLKAAGLDSSMINFGMWTDMLRHVAEVGKGNVFFFDGSTDAMQRTIKQSMALNGLDK